MCSYMVLTLQYIQAAELGRAPTPVEVFEAGHRGKDPANPDVLCSQVATERLVRYCHSYLLILNERNILSH